MERLISRLARRSRISRAEAADQLNRVVCDVLKKLRNGEKAHIPGLGVLAGKPAQFEAEKRNARAR